MSRTLAAIFTNRTSFSQESRDESNKIMKSQKKIDLGAWGLETTFEPLGPRRRIKPYVQNPKLQFSHRGPHFLKNHEMNPIK